MKTVVRIISCEHGLVVFVRHVDTELTDRLLQTDIVEHFDVLPLVLKLLDHRVERRIRRRVRLLVVLSRPSITLFRVFSFLESQLIALCELGV